MSIISTRFSVIRCSHTLIPPPDTHIRPNVRLRGFTLIELLIVIVIISIVSSFAILSININQNKRLETLSSQLVNLFNLAEEEALLRSTTLGFALTPETFQFYEYHETHDPEKTPWIAIADTTLGISHIPSDIQMTLKINNKTITSTTPKIIISPSGDVTPFTILIGKKSSSPRYKIISEGNGNIKSEAIDDKT